ncbi:MAG: ParB/RepB/Spo0J family partition protein [Acetobacteraceae bacterium]
MKSVKTARLGRGLATLMGDMDTDKTEPGTTISTIPIDMLEPNPFQPRGMIEQSQLEELAESIRAQGLLQPIVVRPNPKDPERYEIVAGERRWRAAGLAGLHDIPAVIRNLTDSEAAIVALVENLQRENLNALDEAEGYHRLVTEFSLTQEAVGYAVSKSRAHVTNTLRLLNLPSKLKEHLHAGRLSAGHARALLTHPNPEVAAEKIIAKGLSVRQAEAMAERSGTPRPRRGSGSSQVETRELQRDLSMRLGQRVEIAVDEVGSGKVTIWFADMHQLESIVEQLRRS